ncbi:MAG: hypothetical protein AB1756_01405 [Acidobacteriota bacterium]
MQKYLRLLAFLLIALLILAFPFASAGEEKKKEETKKEEEPYVFTNDDLEKYATEGEKKKAEEVEEEATFESVEEIIKKITEPQAVQKWKEARIAEKEAKVKEAEQRLEYLKKKRASIQNPFLPRPEITEEDQKEEASMDNAKRLERTEKQIEQGEEDLRRAEEELERFKQELRNAGI